MSEIGLNKLKRLGYQFWSSKSPQENLSEEGIVFYVLDNKTLITGKLKEFNEYPRIISSIGRILGLTDNEIRKIDKSELSVNEFNLVIDFAQELSFKTKKIIFKVNKVISIDSKNLAGIKFTYKTNNEITALYERKKHKIDEIINKIKNAGMEIYDISTDEGNLEDVFIDLTKS